MFAKNHQKILCRATGFLAVVLVMVFAVTAVPAEDKEEQVTLNFSGRAVNMTNVGQSGSASVDIQVNRWSTEAERKALWDLLVKNEPKDFWDALGNEKETGWVRVAQSAARTAPSTTMRYAREVKQGDNWEIILVTNRPLSFEEAEAQIRRSTRFNVSIIVLQLTKDDAGTWRGDGQMFVGAELNFNEEKNKLEVKSFASEPVRLQAIALR